MGRLLASLCLAVAALVLPACTGSDEAAPPPAAPPPAAPPPVEAPAPPPVGATAPELSPGPPAPPAETAPDETGPAPAATETAPAASIDLAAVALRADDLPDGTQVLQEGYIDADGTEALYRRLFATEGLTLGASRIFGVECEVALFADAETSRAALERIRQAIATEDGASSYFSQLLANVTGGEVVSLQGTTVPQAEIAEDAVVSSFTFSANDRDYAGVIAFLRYGALQTSVLAIGDGSDLDPNGLDTLVATLSERALLAAQALPPGSLPGDAPPATGEPAPAETAPGPTGTEAPPTDTAPPPPPAESPPTDEPIA
ncbi:MAG: hypothetical protein R3C15_16050 [Thermoleophilia bacterium]